MANDKRPHDPWIWRTAGAVAVLVFVVVAVNGFAILGASASDIVDKQTGISFGPDGQMDVYGQRLGSAVFGDRFVFALRTADGQVSPPALTSTFPVYPGSVIQRSAVYSDVGTVLRGLLYTVPASTQAVLAWYRAELTAQGYRVVSANGALEARRAETLVRVQPDRSAVVHSSGDSATGPALLGIYVSGR